MKARKDNNVNNVCTKSKLSACALGLAVGFSDALYMMLFAWVALYSGYGTPMIDSIASVFYGYAPTFVGGLWGGLWGFIDGYIFGIVVGMIYNFCLCHCHCRSCCGSSACKKS
ncbi:MAG: hypothetical protein P4M12_10430 [Gammaproteobacteria bacterium]|nr:hypothetical protein [Gammaproteobacteria bacterium]